MFRNILRTPRLLIVKLVSFNSSINVSKMATDSKRNVFIRIIDDEPLIQLSFSYTNDIIKERIFNLNRTKDEELSIVFARIQTNIQNDSKRKSRRSRKKNKADVLDKTEEKGEGETSSIIDDSLPITLQNGDKMVPLETKNINAWSNGDILTIGILNYYVLVNFPSVLTLTLPKSIMAGFPVYPKVKLEFSNENETLFSWYSRVFKKDFTNIDFSKVIQNSKEEYWLKLSEGYYYYPSNQDIGRNIKVVCEPRLGERSGKSLEVISPKMVEAGPGLCPFDERHLYTELFAPFGSFRCITYNILADLYADSKFSRETLFPYCPEYALDFDYRRQLICKEIIGYKGDLIFLQEVDKKVFQYDLQPLFKSTGLNGVFNVKGGQVAEGLATFYRDDKFRLIESEVIILSECLQNDPLVANFLETICKNDKLKQRVLARTTAMQIALLESVEDPKRLLLTGNVHLYFHPNADHIRLFQAALCVHILENRIKQTNLNNPNKNCSLILSGDFNSCPEFGVYKLMTTGNVDQNSEDWKSNPEEAIVDFNVSHSLSLDSACGSPKYTNYTLGFNGCLDYIFYDKSQLIVTDIVPMPTHEEVTQYSAIPNTVFPSDHLALICTLKWI